MIDILKLYIIKKVDSKKLCEDFIAQLYYDAQRYMQEKPDITISIEYHEGLMGYKIRITNQKRNVVWPIYIASKSITKKEIDLETVRYKLYQGVLIALGRYAKAPTRYYLI